MTDREAAGLRRLKLDLDEADWPSPELLARYATEPNRLSETDKQVVERALASSKIVADELATLRGFDFSRLDADRNPVGSGAERARAHETTKAGWLARLRGGWLAPLPVWAAAAALLALAYWAAQSGRAPVPTATPELPPQLAERAASPPEPAEPPETAAPAPEPTQLTEAEPAPDSSLARRETTTAQIPEAAPNEALPVAEEKPELLLAMAMAMPDYHPAYGLAAEGGSEWTLRSGAAADLRIVALVPDHVARACSASPPLHWSIDRVPEQGQLLLTIVDGDDEPIVLDRPIARPVRAGRQRLDLASLAVVLPPGKTLRWSVAFRDDSAGAPRAFDFGWLRVEAPDAAQAMRLADRGEAARAAAYAELGCYSEALEAALLLRAAHPGDPAPGQAVAKLAQQAGLDPKLLAD